MKKVLAIAISLLLTLGMFAGSITVSAETTAAITVKDVETTPGATETVEIAATNFSDVAGMDLTVTFDEGLQLGDPSCDKFTLTENDNYTLENNVLHIVDAFVGDSLSAFTVTVDVTAAAEGTYGVTLDGKFANESENFITPTLTRGVVTVENASKSTETQEDEAIDMEALGIDLSKYFVPMGGVYDSDDKYITKNADGKFIGNGNTVTIKYFKLPADGEALTTFGASSHKADVSAKDDRDKQNGIQFGSYVTKWKEKKGFGTLLIVGDFAKFKVKYAGNTNLDTDEKIFNKFVSIYADKVESVYGENGTNPEPNFEEKRYVKFSVDADEYIYVTRVTQKKFMWHKVDGTEMQYALRVYGINTSKNYTAVGYAVKDSKFEFSANVKSASWSDFDE